MSETFTPVVPSTGAPAEPIPVTSPEGVERAVQAARTAAKAWGALDYETRAACLSRCAAALVDHADDLAARMASDMGKPIKFGRGEVRSVQARVKGLIETGREAVTPSERSNDSLRVRVRWLPLGVAGVIGPWNFPISTPNTLVVSALLTGNAVVFKPSENASQTGLRYVDVMREAMGEHANALQVVTGAGTVGRAIVDHPAIDLVAFTGSIATGQAIMRSAATTLKRLVLELGGKDPMIVLGDADVEAAAAHAVRSSLHNTGQVCVAAERVFVHASIHDRFVDAVKRGMQKLVVGDPADQQTDLGPLANAGQRELVLAHVADATAAGATAIVEGTASDTGFYLEPTLLTGVADDMRIAREETFGPVVAISRFDHPQEALARANATPYGLGASIWGAPGPALDRLADGIEAGMVGVNRGLSASLGAPWVGWKHSGFGYTRSVEGMRQFMIPQSQSRPASSS